MEVDDKKLLEMSDLIIKGLDNAICSEEFDRLQDLLRTDPAAVDYYRGLIATFAYMDVMKELGIDRRKEDLDRMLEELAEIEKNAPATEIPKEDPRPELDECHVHPVEEKRKRSRFTIFTLITAAAAVLMIALSSLFVSPETSSVREVATVVDQVNVKWADSSRQLENGSRLSANEAPLNLRKGIVKIQYDDGVNVLVEGPAIFEIERLGIYLDHGRLYSRVSESGLGFTIKTPATQFVDLGTEFGIHVESNGSSELHVLKGKVQLFAGSKGSSKTSQIVTENKAVRYNANSDRVKTVPVAKNAFVRQVDSQTKMIWRGQDHIDLADIVGGGNGFGTGKVNRGISLETGEPVQTFREHGVKKEKIEYQLVRANPFIDGVFVPDSKNGKGVQITSQGHIYQDYQSTSGTYNSSIFNNRTFETVYGSISLSRDKNEVKPLICIHSNAGMTFDLEAMRQHYRYFEFDSFSVSIGIALEAKSIDHDSIDSDVYVLVDGKSRNSVNRIVQGEEPFDVHIAIQPGDRFLTLASAEGVVNAGDWVVFENPRLHIYERNEF